MHDEDGVRIVGNVSGYFREVLVHRMNVVPRHDVGRRLPLIRADGTDDLSGAGSLIMWRWGP